MNLIYIFADQWRRDAIGYWSPSIHTPRLDAFMKDSMVFQRAYSSSPLCSPARACLLTGRQPNATGAFTNCKPGVNACLRENLCCISDVFKQQGYATGYIGKWHLDRPDGSFQWDAYTPPGKRRHGFDFWYSYGACDCHTTPHYWDTNGARHMVNKWSTVHETDVALQFLQAKRKGDFVLFLSYNPPHPPYELTPEPYAQLYRGTHREITANTPAPQGRGDPMGSYEDFDREVVQNYYGAITVMDEQFGRIVDYLKENNLYNSTYIVVSADHGEMLGDHGRISKSIWYEGAVGIPFVVGGGGVCPGISEALVSTPDQSATLLGLLGIQADKYTDGVDYTPLILRSERVEQESVMTAMFPYEEHAIKEYVRHGRNFMDYGWRSVITRKYKLAVDKGCTYGCKPRRYLYSLQRDFNENECIHDKAVMEYMMGQLRHWLVRWGDGFLEDCPTFEEKME